MPIFGPYNDSIKLRGITDDSKQSGLTVALLPSGGTAPGDLISLTQDTGINWQYNFSSSIINDIYKLYINSTVAQINSNDIYVMVKRAGNPGMNFLIDKWKPNNVMQHQWAGLVRNFVVDLYLDGTPAGGEDYSITLIHRNYSGQWWIGIYDTSVTLICVFSTGVDPENGDEITVHQLAESGGSGISGEIAVRWSVLDDGGNYGSMVASGDWKLSTAVFSNKENFYLNIQNNISDISSNAATLATHTTQIASKIGFDTDGGIKTAFIANETWKHSRGDSEYDGDSAYAALGLGIYKQFDEGVVFTDVSLAIWWDYITDTGRVRIYKHSTLWDRVDVDDMTLLKEVEVTPTNINLTDGELMTLETNQINYVAAGEYIYVLVEADINGRCQLERWTSQSGSPPYRENLIFCTSAPWSNSWSVGSGSYLQTPMLLELNNGWDKIQLLSGVSSEIQAQLDNRIEFDSDGGIKGFLKNPVWTHPRGAAEYVGAANYSWYNMGFWQEIYETTIFKGIQLKVWSSLAVEVRVYLNETGAVINNPSSGSLTLIETINYAAGEFNTTTDSLMHIMLTDWQKVFDGDIIQVFIVTGVASGMSMRRWTSLAGAEPERTVFYIVNDPSPFTVAWSATGSPNYLATPFYFTRGNELSSLTQDDLDGKQDLPSPRMVIPSDVYIAVDRELNIWFDAIALMFPGQNYYSFVFNESIAGIIKNRSFRYSPAGTYSYALDISALDPNGVVLQTISTTLNAVSKTAGSGTKQILCIGDSLN